MSISPNLTLLANAALLLFMLRRRVKSAYLWLIQGPVIAGSLFMLLNRWQYAHGFITWQQHDTRMELSHHIQHGCEWASVVYLFIHWRWLQRIWPARFEEVRETDTLVMLAALTHLIVRLDWDMEYIPDMLESLRGLLMQGDICNLMLIGAMGYAVFCQQRNGASEEA